MSDGKNQFMDGIGRMANLWVRYAQISYYMDNDGYVSTVYNSHCLSSGDLSVKRAYHAPILTFSLPDVAAAHIDSGATIAWAAVSYSFLLWRPTMGGH